MDEIEVIELSDDDGENCSPPSKNVEPTTSSKSWIEEIPKDLSSPRPSSPLSSSLSLSSFEQPTSSNAKQFEFEDVCLASHELNFEADLNNEEDNNILLENWEKEEVTGVTEPPQKKKRTKRPAEEIQKEKLQKELTRVLREISTSKNSKCEQNLFCHVSSLALSLTDNIEEELRKIFTERNIQNQLVVEATGPGKSIIWWERKCIEAYISREQLQKKTFMESQEIFAYIVDTESFSQLLRGKKFAEFVEQTVIRAGPQLPQLRPYLIVLGQNVRHDNDLLEVTLNAFEKHKLQIRFMKGAKELALFVVQMHRAIAKLEKKKDQTGGLQSKQLDKGVAEGAEMVSDWWNRMLGQIHRILEVQRRAIVKHYPNPLALMDRLLASSPGDAMYELARIKLENGNQLGPVLAQRLYNMLTSVDGAEVIDSGCG